MNGNLRNLWYLIDKNNQLATLIVLMKLNKKNKRKNIKKISNNIILKQTYKVISYLNKQIKLDIVIIIHNTN
jgi:hypothetical protein